MDNDKFYTVFTGDFCFSPYFLKGYKAYVYGGKNVKFSGNGFIKSVSGGIQPDDDLTPEQKAEWQAGIQYAKKERKECRKLK